MRRCFDIFIWFIEETYIGGLIGMAAALSLPGLAAVAAWIWL